MELGKYEEALPKLERAQKADPGIGTMFNIAVCQQKLGRLGTAYRVFREVTTLARASGKKAREDAARAKLEEIKVLAPAYALRPRDAGDLTVRIDGEPIKKEDWGFYPVDPGEHAVEAVAPAKKSWSTTVSSPAAGKLEEIAIPALETATRTTVVTVTDNRRTLGYAVGGMGAAGLVAAVVTGALLLNAHGTANDNCPNKVCRNTDGTQNQKGADAVSLGKTLLPINGIAWGLAALGLGTGAFLLVTSSREKKAAPARVMLTPSFDPSGRGSGGASLTGSF